MNKNASRTKRNAKKRSELAEYFVCKIEQKFCSLPTVTRQLVIQAFETGYKAGQLDPRKWAPVTARGLRYEHPRERPSGHRC